MRAMIKYPIALFSFLFVSLIISCEKEEKKLPVLTTMEVWSIFQRSAMSGGTIINDGGAPVLDRGTCWSTSPEPTLSDNHVTGVDDKDPESFVSTLNGLKLATVYYVRAYATNKNGTGYGDEVTFESAPLQLPVVSTDPEVTSITSNSAVSGGIINYSGGDSVTAKGICWNIITAPTLDNPHTMDGSGNDHYLSHLSGLSGNTTYYVRSYAVNSVGTAYGNEVSFTTFSDSAAVVLFSPVLFNTDLTYGTVTDADYNEYKTIQIGSQTWMAENLKTTVFRNGAQIGNLTVVSAWSTYTLDAFCWYDNNVAFKTIYGGLYNWYAVNTGNLCPAGWHVPSSGEFETLITFLGGEGEAAVKLKESSSDHWLPSDAGADNESGFSALPGGFLSAGEFLFFRSAGYWWSSSESNPASASCITIGNNINPIGVDTRSKTTGMSIRCIKD